MPHTVHGLPLHVLLVHGVVVLVPLAAVLVVAAAASAQVRARLGVLLPALALSCAVLVPVTQSAGRWLRSQLPPGQPLVERHQHLAAALLPWVLAVAVLSVVVWLRGRRPPVATPHGSPRRAARVGALGAVRTSLLVDLVVLALAAVVAVGTVVQVVRVGESGSRAVWDGVVSTSR